MIETLEASVGGSLRYLVLWALFIFSLAVANKMATLWPCFLAARPSPRRLGTQVCGSSYSEQLTVRITVGED